MLFPAFCVALNQILDQDGNVFHPLA